MSPFVIDDCVGAVLEPLYTHGTVGASNSGPNARVVGNRRDIVPLDCRSLHCLLFFCWANDVIVNPSYTGSSNIKVRVPIVSSGQDYISTAKPITDGSPVRVKLISTLSEPGLESCSPPNLEEGL